MPKQVFRSPTAVVAWWIWVLFAVGNLIDIAVQGRDRSSLVAALVLVAVTGVMYVGARRPRLIADDAGLVIVNPLREYRVGWAAVTAIDTTELIRVRCEWPAGPGGERRQQAIYAWAVGSSRRRQALMRVRAERHAWSGPGGSSPSAAEPGDADKIVAALTARASEARKSPAATGGSPVTGPVSTWCWPAFAVAGIPVLALLAVLAV